MNAVPLSFNIVHGEYSYSNATPGGLIEAGVPAATVLALVRERLKEAVDIEAEALRSRIITAGSGQAMEYQEAQTQAAAALKATSSATPEKYPMLAASIGIDIDPTTKAPATDVIGVARAVIAAYQAWQTIGSEIRKVRLTGKAAIDTATTVEEAQTAAAGIVWPTLAA